MYFKVNLNYLKQNYHKLKAQLLLVTYQLAINY